MRLQMPNMEGTQARWYAEQRSSVNQLAAVRDDAQRLTADLPAGSSVLEVAPGPGFMAVELARRGYNVSAQDLSHSFVDITAANAAKAGVSIDIRQGDAAALQFADGAFDLILCQAAFKNFGKPVDALDEMYRVLRPGATAIIQDMNRDCTVADINHEVDQMGLSRRNAFMTRIALRGLRYRAYSAARFQDLARQSVFGGCITSTDGITLEVRLQRPQR